MNKSLIFLAFMLLLNACKNSKVESITSDNHLLPTAIPLITIDPYFSCWSFSNKLNEQSTKHWTGDQYTMNGIILVDGVAYRFMGADEHGIVDKPSTCVYTTIKPDDNWYMTGVKLANSKKGEMPLGNKDRWKHVKTHVESDTIWIKTTFTLQSTENIKLKVNSSNKNLNRLKIYINGIHELSLAQHRKDILFPLSDKAKQSLKTGKNEIAVMCIPRMSRNNNLIDIGFYQEKAITKAVQNNLRVNATQSIYDFTCGNVDLQLCFTSPLLMDDLYLISRPASYVDFKVKSNDGNKHDVKIYWDASTEWCVNNANQLVTTEQYSLNNNVVLKAGTVDQPILQTSGDDVRIDWGYLYLTASNAEAYTGETKTLLGDFISNKNLVQKPTLAQTPAKQLQSLALVYHLESVDNVGKSAFGVIAYDDIYSVEYFGQRQKAYWKHIVPSTDSMLLETLESHDDVISKCQQFDQQAFETAMQAGGKEYAELCMIAYRQAISAHKLTMDEQGTPLFFSKENYSNGSMATVDVTYPSAPLFLLYNTTLLKGMLEPIFYYSESGLWTKPIAAHDIGKYPLGNGQKYGEDMPIEECGNMLIMTAAICMRDKDYGFAQKHWDVLSIWANYLKEAGYDPENQLCTDDFAGHLAHNANLSVKAIVALKCYSAMAKQLGYNTLQMEYESLSNQMVKQWINAAYDGTHYSLTFDRKGTWSQKYNLVWDKLLGLNLFPDSVINKEIAFYLVQQNEFGLPLDGRSDYTKTDWIFWTATMASDDDFSQFISPIYKSVLQSKDRQPLTDWYNTKTGMVTGFRARSVVGGFYIKQLENAFLK